MKKFLFITLFFALIFAPILASAYVAASSNYRLEKDNLNFGGTDFSLSSNYKISDTFGDIISGVLDGITYDINSGYRYEEPDPVVVVSGCTDPTASNYNVLATVDDGSCILPSSSPSSVTPPLPEIPVPGCTDPLALNYNSRATIDNGSCVYAGVPNVSGFRAQYSASQKAISLTWENPDFDFASIIIRRKIGSAPLSPIDGQLIYNNTGEEVWDNNVAVGVTYYYTAFVHDQNNRQSSGAVASAHVPTGEEERNEEEEQAEGTPFGDGGDGAGAAGAGLLSQLSLPNAGGIFHFLQPGEKEKTFDQHMTVRIIADKDLIITFENQQALSLVKSIGVTLTDPTDTSKTFSFLLSLNQTGTSYTATIAPLQKQGTYPIVIYLYGHNGQIIGQVKGVLIVIRAGLLGSLEQTAKDVAVPVATTGLAIGFLPSLQDILTILGRALGYIFGRRRKGEPWGTVYDSVTKRPLDPAYVIAEQIDPAGGWYKKVAEAITDIDGRFSFFLPAGTYHFKANKTHYRFPSTRLAGQTSDELYNHLYFGGALISTGEVLGFNIPLDPIDFDWNEFAKSKTDFFQFYDRRQRWLKQSWKVCFAVGLAFAFYASYLDLSLLNILAVGLYGVIYWLNNYWHEKRKPLKIFNRLTREPLSFAILRVYLPGTNQLIKFAVADQYGRFYLLVRPGVYYYTVEEKQPDGSYLKVYQSAEVSLPKGILPKDISVK